MDADGRPHPRLIPDLRRHRGLAIAGWGFCWIVILFAGLWPLQFHPPNGVRWLASENGLSFQDNGEAYFPHSLSELTHSQDGSFTLELLLRPERQAQPHVAYILSDSLADARPGLILLQYGTYLILQTRYREATPALRKLGVDGALLPAQLVHVALVSGTNGTRVYVNGKQEMTFHHPIAVEQFAGPLVIGNSGRPGYEWSGDLFGFALYPYPRTERQVQEDASAWMARHPVDGSAVALYEFTERSGEWAYSTNPYGPPLHVPRHLMILHRSMLSWDLKLDGSGLWDITENVAGFIPFGFFGAAVLAGRRSHRTSLLGAICVGFLVSLAIELTQASLPLRDSSSVDLLTNTLGTAGGAAFFGLTYRRRPHSLRPKSSG